MATVHLSRLLRYVGPSRCPRAKNVNKTSHTFKTQYGIKLKTQERLEREQREIHTHRFRSLSHTHTRVPRRACHSRIYSGVRTVLTGDLIARLGCALELPLQRIRALPLGGERGLRPLERRGVLARLGPQHAGRPLLLREAPL